MTSAKSATEAAVFAVLNAGIVGATVYQDVPEDTPPPVVILGDLESEALGGKNDPDRRISLSIATIVQAEERKPLLDLQEQIETLLDGVKLTAGGWEIHPAFLSDDAVVGGDGATYFGSSRFEILALRA